MNDSRQSWQARQDWMAREYDELLNDGDHAARGFENDYRDISNLLASYHGRIVDIGGGIGVTRHWLPPQSEYVLVEPSLMWHDSRWMAFVDRFPCLAQHPRHVIAYGEALPFADGSFDAALLLWSLNHMFDPLKTVREAVRVLVRGGRLLIALEDGEPTWTDLWQRKYPDARSGASVKLLLRKLASPALGWPVQGDHIPVSERAVIAAAGGRLLKRGWMGLYLTLEFEA
jgi:SAM-dependent methyltransferase